MIEAEWRAFLAAAEATEPQTRAFCWTLARTGGRLSEVRTLTPRSFDVPNDTIRIRCLKRRVKNIYREIPLGREFKNLLDNTIALSLKRSDLSVIDIPIWPWCRTTAWQRMKDVARAAGLPEFLCTPKVLRHTFGIEGVLIQNIPLGTMQKWMGHARLESTVVYTTPVGQEERELSSRMWRSPPTPTKARSEGVYR